jgi:hypothetical protein
VLVPVLTGVTPNRRNAIKACIRGRAVRSFTVSPYGARD